MTELFAFGAIALALLILIGILGSIAALVCWIIVLPFKLLGLAFKAIALLLALPFILIAGLFGLAVFGTGLIVALMPALPLVLLILGIVWLARRGSRVRTA